MNEDKKEKYCKEKRFKRIEERELQGERMLEGQKRLKKIMSERKD